MRGEQARETDRGERVGDHHCGDGLGAGGFAHRRGLRAVGNLVQRGSQGLGIAGQQAAVFIGVVGLTAGPTFVSGLKATGPSLLLVGFLVAVTPHVAALFFGRYVLKMNPVLLFGACSGAGTVTAALRGIQDEADSKLPVLGYTVPYAVGNILLTAWGPVIVMILK